jgi:ubiquinone/menaquinone biosynthesis C-methylase UbiE
MERVLEPEVMDTVEEAESYDAMDHSAPNSAFVDRLVELGAGGSVLDIGCGPGHVPLMLVAMLPEAEVLGVDLSKEMLRIAEEHRAASAHAERVRFQLGDAKGLEFPDGSFDTVCSNTILHHIPDPVPFLREAGRVLRPGGALLIRDLFRPVDAATVDALVAEHAAGEAERARELFRASLCAALTPEELRAAADAAGLETAEIVVDTDRHLSLQVRAETHGDS